MTNKPTIVNSKPPSEKESNPLAFVPPFVWQAAITAAVVVIVMWLLIVLYFHHASVNDALASEVTAIIWVFVVAGIVLAAYVGYRIYLSVRAHHYRFKQVKLQTEKLDVQVKKAGIQNELLTAQLNLWREAPSLIQYAQSQGNNVTLHPTSIEITSPWSNVHNLGPGGIQQQQIAGPADDYIPEPYKFSDVLQNWTPSESGILLAKGRDLITVPIGEDLGHTSFTGPTDGGKTNDERFLMIQLVYLQQTVYLCDRNYQPFREDRKLGLYYEYIPIADRLAHEPIVETKQAVALLEHLYGIVDARRVERRKVRSADALVSFKDIYLFFDELPAFAGEDPKIMELIGRLLREARQYGVFVTLGAQDLLNQTLDNKNGAIRDNLLTNFYGGGDDTTGRFVLNLAKGEQLNELGLGKQGLKYLHSKGASIGHMRVRTPFSDNEATKMLLDGAPYPIVQEEIPGIVDAIVEEQDNISEFPQPMRVLGTGKPTPTLEDAIEVWNEAGARGVTLSRYTMMDKLAEKGFECKENQARRFVEKIKETLEEGQNVVSR